MGLEKASVVIMAATVVLGIATHGHVLVPAAHASASQESTHTTNDGASSKPHGAPSGMPFSIRKQMARLDRVIKDHPNNRDALIQRAQLHAALHEYHRAAADLEAAKRVQPLYPVAALGLCMLEERLHGLTGQVKRCYRRVTSRFRKRGRSDQQLDANYVLAASMARDPGAGRLRARYLKQVGQANPTYRMIKDFNREGFLKTNMP